MRIDGPSMGEGGRSSGALGGLWTWLSIAAALAAAYALGVASATRLLPPVPQIRALKQSLFSSPPPPGREIPPRLFSFHPDGRLSGDVRKSEIACPPQTPQMAVILVLGQSNAANHGGQRYATRFGERVVNLHGGRCFLAVSPLLGASGTGGEYWTELGNRLVSAAIFDRVLIVPLAIGATNAGEWARGGPLNPLVRMTAQSLHDLGFRVTHVLWHQGESDRRLRTSEENYHRQVSSVAETLRQSGIDAPFHVSVASHCLGLAPAMSDNPIARAQRNLASGASGIKAGIDTDAGLDDLDRYDDCHFAASGQEKAVAAWIRILSPGTGSRPSGF